MNNNVCPFTAATNEPSICNPNCKLAYGLGGCLLLDALKKITSQK